MNKDIPQLCHDGGRKSLSAVAASAAMLLPAAFLFFVVSGLPHVFIIVCAGLMLSFAVRRPFKFSDRSIIYSIVASLALAVPLDMVFPMRQERFFSLGKLFMLQITAPTLLYMAVLATFFESSPYTFGINAAFSMIIIMLASDFRMSSQPQQTSLFSNLLLRSNFSVLFTVFAAMFCLSMTYAFNLAGKTLFHTRRRGFDTRKAFAFTASLAAVALLTYTAISIFDAYRNDLRKLEHYLTRMMGTRPSGGDVLFGDEIDLNSTISDSLRKNLNTVMIRVRGPQAPGYLRGRAYQYYNNGRWRDTQEPPENMKFELNIGRLALNAFFFEEASASPLGTRFDILPASGCRAEYLFFPPATKRFELVADRLESYPNGMLKPVSWEHGAGYSVTLTQNPPHNAFPMPREFVKASYLNVPQSLAPATASLAIKAGLGKTPENLTSDRDTSEKIIAHLKNSFSYTLFPETPERGTDPAAHFITSSGKGHCELFATTAAMLLRHCGIPSRYVTGFVCSEPHPSGTYFVARGGDAHAWCEAYLRDEKKWVAIDPTPDAGFQETTGGWSLWSSWTDLLKMAVRQLMADVRRGYVAKAVISFVISIFTLARTVLWHPARGLMSLVAAALMVLYLIRRRGKKQGFDIELHRLRDAARKQINLLVSAISKKTGLKKKQGQTVTEWWTSVKLHYTLPTHIKTAFQDIMSLYHRTRFSTSPASESDIASLCHSCTQFLKTLRKEQKWSCQRQ
ncbi:MAG: transglutaminase domain-containing protein [Victivallales bacterium]|nr:transglutaminase domain-containing protein [Victivallales bacterium]